MKKASELIQSYLKEEILSNEKLNSSFLISKYWEDIFGNFSSNVNLLNVKDEKILIVSTSNSSFLYSLQMNKRNYLEKIKELTNLDIVELTVILK